MRYQDPATGRFAQRPEPPAPPKLRSWYRVVVDRGRQRVPRGPWRDEWAEAMQDAIELELTCYDRSRREHYLAVPVAIASRSGVERPAD